MGLGVCFSVYLFGGVVWDYYKIRGWQEVPAQIISVQLDDEEGEDEIPKFYMLEAEYEYVFQGVTYSGELYTSGFNQEEKLIRFQSLMKQKETGEPIRCLVNPDSPTDSKRYRKKRWGLIILVSLVPLFFSFLGLTGLYLLQRIKLEVREQIEQEHS